MQALPVPWGSAIMRARFSLHVEAGETPGIVGESGSGKSITAKSVIRLTDVSPTSRSPRSA